MNIQKMHNLNVDSFLLSTEALLRELSFNLRELETSVLQPCFTQSSAIQNFDLIDQQLLEVSRILRNVAADSKLSGITLDAAIFNEVKLADLKVRFIGGEAAEVNESSQVDFF